METFINIPLPQQPAFPFLSPQAALRDLENTCQRLIGRTEEQAKKTSLYLAADIGGVVFRLQGLLGHLPLFNSEEIIEMLNPNATNTIKDIEQKCLQTIKQLESILITVDGDWTEVSQEIHHQILALNGSLIIHATDVRLVWTVAKHATCLQTTRYEELRSSRQEIFKELKTRREVLTVQKALQQVLAQNQMAKTQHQDESVMEDNSSVGFSTGMATPNSSNGSQSDDGTAQGHHDKVLSKVLFEEELADCASITIDFLKKLDLAKARLRTTTVSTQADFAQRKVLQESYKEFTGELANVLDLPVAGLARVARAVGFGQSLESSQIKSTASDEVLESIGAQESQRDIAKLVFYWTVMGNVGVYKRGSVGNMSDLAPPASWGQHIGTGVMLLLIVLLCVALYTNFGY